MRASAIGQQARTAMGRRCSAPSRRQWVKFRLLVASVIVGGGWFFYWWTDWPVRILTRTRPEPYPLAFSPDGKTVVIVEPGGLTLWDVTTGQKRASWTASEDRRFYEGVFAPDGQTFARFPRDDGSGRPLVIDLIDVASGVVRASIPSPGGQPVHGGLAFSDDGRNLRVIVPKGTAVEVAHYDVTASQESSSRILSCTLGGFAGDRPSRSKRTKNNAKFCR
jgi:hypothetical protein